MGGETTLPHRRTPSRATTSPVMLFKLALAVLHRLTIGVALLSASEDHWDAPAADLDGPLGRPAVAERVGIDVESDHRAPSPPLRHLRIGQRIRQSSQPVSVDHQTATVEGSWSDAPGEDDMSGRASGSGCVAGDHMCADQGPAPQDRAKNGHRSHDRPRPAPDVTDRRASYSGRSAVSAMPNRSRQQARSLLRVRAC